MSGNPQQTSTPAPSRRRFHRTILAAAALALLAPNLSPPGAGAEEAPGAAGPPTAGPKTTMTSGLPGTYELGGSTTATAPAANGTGLTRADRAALAETRRLRAEVGGLADPEPVSGVEADVRAALAEDERVPVIVRLTDQLSGARLAEVGRNAGLEAMRSTTRATRGAGASRARAVRIGDAARAAQGTAVVNALREHARAEQGAVAGVLRDLRGAGHASAATPYWIFNGFAARLDASAVDRLAAHPDVASISLDREVRLPAVAKEEAAKVPTWGLDRIGAPRVWGEYGHRGAGVVVGVMDSGADGEHPAIAGSWRGTDGDVEKSWFVPTREDYPTPADGYGHGTHVTGTIAGGTPGEVIGVAPAAQWIGVKIFNDGGASSDSIIHSGFQWMMAPGGDPAAAPDLVNNSWGAAAPNRTEFWADVDAWVSAGIVPMFANGNEGPAPGTVGSPGSFPMSIGIGATDYEDVIAGFSSRGPVTWDGIEYLKPQLSAPGHRIRSAWPLHSSETGYESISGTSMATPHASGAVALVLEAAPQLDIAAVRGLLEGTARTEPHMNDLPDNDYGEGILDVRAAVVAAAHSGVLTGRVTGTSEPVAVRVVGEDWTTSVTTGEGNYSVVVPEGAQQVRFTARGLAPVVLDVTMAAGGTQVRDVAMAAAATHQLTGTVTDADGQPVVGARVTVDAGSDAAAYTGTDGGYTTTVEAGARTVHVLGTGFRPWSGTVEVAGPARLDARLTRLGSPSSPGWAQAQNNPAHTGLTSQELAASGLAQTWQRDIGAGIVFSSPVMADGTLYLNRDDGTLVAVDAATGEEKWTHKTGAYLRGSPAVGGGLVVVGGGQAGGFTALDAATGEQVWHVETPGLVTIYAQPAIARDAVFAATGPTTGASDKVYAINLADGTVRWSAEVGEGVFANPSVAGDHVVVASATESTITGLDRATGEQEWQISRSASRDFLIGGTSQADGVVYATTSHVNETDGSMLALDAATGDVLWENIHHTDGQGTMPAVYGDLVIAGAHGNGAIRAYDRVTGEIRWKFSESPAISSSPLVTADGFVVATSQLANQVFALNASDGSLAWRDTMPGNLTSTPAYDRGVLAVADGSGMVRAYGATGTVRGTVRGPDGPVEAVVRVVGSDQRTTSDPTTGAYELALPPGTWTLRASRFGLSSSDAEVVVNAGRTTEQDFTLAAVGTGDLDVVVTDGTDPLAGAVVRLVDTPLDPVTTGADGTASFADLPVGTYEVEAALGGYATARADASVTAGATARVELTLTQYEVGVLGDYQGRMVAELRDLGFSAEASSYADITADPDRYGVVVANGAEDDPGADAFTAFVAATDAAGTSVVWLDQWGMSWGSIDQLSEHLGDPAALHTGYSHRGRVGLEVTADHPLTAGLDPDALNELLVPQLNEWSAFSGYSGRSVADVWTDQNETVGRGLAYGPRTMTSTHVLVANLAAAASWGVPDEWTPAAHRVLENAVTFARDARFGEVAGTVSGEGGAPVAARVTDTTTGLRTRAGDDGAYRLVLEPGEHVLRFTARGLEAVERTVTVTAEQRQRLDVSLTGAGAGSLSGTVTGSDGQPLAGATVTVDPEDPDGPLGIATTAADGTYAVADVPNGAHTVRVGAAGHLTDTAEVSVQGATTHDVRLRASLRVGVLGDYDGQFAALLDEHEFVAQPIAWTDTARLADLDVVVVNDPSDPGAATFAGFVSAMEAAGVSAVWSDGRYSSDGGVRLLVKYEGDPAGRLPVLGDQGRVHYTATMPDHPIFAGLGTTVDIMKAGANASAIKDYSGTPIADIGTASGGRAGTGIAYRARAGNTVHLLMGGTVIDYLQNIEDDWTVDGRQLFAQAVAWAATAPVGSASGTVTDTSGAPMQASVKVVGSPLKAVATKADGTWSLALPAGEHTLRFTSFGHDAAERTVTVRAGENTTLDVSLAPSATASVVDGTVTLGGEPVAGATVRLLGTPRSATTAADGTYEISRVEPGTYTLEVTATGAARHQQQVTVPASGRLTVDVALDPSAAIGVIDDYQSKLAAYLTYWGHRPVALTWRDTARLADLDAVVANGASASGQDPGRAGFEAFERAAVEADTSVLWLDQSGRGTIRYLRSYAQNPKVRDAGFNAGEARAAVKVAGHPVTAGLPGSFEVVTAGQEHSWFDDYDGQVLIGLSNQKVSDVDLAGVRPRGPHSVDLVLGSLSVSTYGSPGYGSTPAVDWTPSTERLLRNAIDFAIDPGVQGARISGTMSAGGSPVAGTLRFARPDGSGLREIAVGADGTYTIGVPPGTWELTGDTFSQQPRTAEVTVAAGESTTVDLALDADPVGSLAGTVTGDGTPVEGASVTLRGTDLSATTGADGTYRIASVPVGTYTVVVRADGFVTRRRSVEITDDAETTADFALQAAAAVAVIGDTAKGAVSDLLTRGGFTPTRFTITELADVQARLGEFDVVILNDSVYSEDVEQLGTLLDAAAKANVSFIAAGQWGGDALASLRTLRGDPEQLTSSFKEAPISYTPTTAHPIFEGYEVGRAITLMQRPEGTNQQYLSYSGYSGTTIADVGETKGSTTLGSGVGYRFTSSSSVEVLLATLGASGYGAPGDNWTDDAETVYLNAVRWAAFARQGSVHGTVTSGGQPVDGAKVEVLGAGASGTTSPDGSYDLGVIDGTWTVRFSAKGYAPVEKEVTVADAARVRLDAELSALARGSLAGTVASPAGPVAGAVVTATGPDDVEVTTDAAGAFSAPDLLPGEYTLEVHADGHLPLTHTVSVTAGQTTRADLQLVPITVAVVGDDDGALTELLRGHDVPAGALEWSQVGDLAPYEVVLVNGAGKAGPDAAAYTAFLAEADAEQVSVVHLGTWGVDQGGVRLLEKFTDRVQVAGQGYGAGPVQVTGFDAAHRLFAGLKDPATLITEGGYWSTVAGYDGTALAQLRVTRPKQEPVTGTAIGWTQRTPGSIELVLAASAATPVVGPELGWTEDHTRLLLNAVAWGADADEETPQPGVPAAPTLQVPTTLTADASVTASGTAEAGTTVTVRRGGAAVATTTAGAGGAWSVAVPLVEGTNTLTATAANAAGTSAPSAAVAVARDTTGPVIVWREPRRTSGTFSGSVVVSGQVTDAPAGVASVQVRRTGARPVEARLSGDGSFRVTVRVRPGRTSLRLHATDRLGNATTTGKRVVVRKKWKPRWQVAGRSVTLRFAAGPDGRKAPAARAVLVLERADGSRAGRVRLVWRGGAYRARLPKVRAGRYDLAATLRIGRVRFDADGPRVRVR